MYRPPNNQGSAKDKKTKMKQDEIKNGDWVLYHSAPIKVAETELQVFSAWDKDGNFLDIIPYENAAPIPLTKKILEENGWHIREHYYYGGGCEETIVYRNDANILEIRQYPHSVFAQFVAYLYGEYLRPFNHVHELQHLSWALGEDSDLKIV